MDDDEKAPRKVTDIDALAANTLEAVHAFADRWLPMPRLTETCEVMDVRQLRDVMGLRATIEAGDPWPAAERELLSLGFRWHWLGTCRVMFLQERDDYQLDDGWNDGEEIDWDE